ncbi:CocE/NonD family hydrolase [Actinomadura chokoriensis]|uniref:CocE/NonD family hydrolase n=1 Tax=Actinomadura chokoriensis TaxID=454156 RepID=A0ABV4QWT2_9ACTN
MTERDTVPDRPAGQGGDVVELLLRLRSLNVRTWTADGAVHYDAPPGVLDSALRRRIADREQAIVEYLGNSDDHEHTTVYIPMRDGARLAADIMRPRRDGAVVTDPLPVLWCHDRYRRSQFEDGVTRTKLDTRPWLRAVLRSGYVIVAVDARGTGASSGTRSEEFGETEASDGYEVTEWLAGRPWCDGAVGMFGDSYLAVAQLLTAAKAPPHLGAIFPQMPLFDLYSFLYPGGVFRDGFVRHWADRVRRLDVEAGVTAVTGHGDASRRAVAEHRGNYDVLARAELHPYRDSRRPDGTAAYRRSPAGAVAEINASGIPVCLLSGWFDIWVRDAVLWFENLTVPKKLTIGPFAHTGRDEVDLAAEHLRWFDHWLKGVDTGVMTEPPLRYRVMGADPGRAWRTAERWPVEGEPTKYYFRRGPSGSIESVNDGLLCPEPPGPAAGADEYVADYSTTSGDATRWADGYGGPYGYRPLTENDAKALTYTTEVLSQPVEVIGHPIAHVFVESTYPDGDFFVYLEEVDEAGASHYVTEGVLRASHRRLGLAPYSNFGLPYHPSAEAAVEDLPSLPVELVIDLHPTAFRLTPGKRLRVAITCRDRGNADSPVHSPPPTVRIYGQRGCASYLELPVVPGEGSARSAVQPARNDG